MNCAVFQSISSRSARWRGRSASEVSEAIFFEVFARIERRLSVSRRGGRHLGRARDVVGMLERPFRMR